MSRRCPRAALAALCFAVGCGDDASVRDGGPGGDDAADGDADADGQDGGCADPEVGSNRIFVTSTKHDGNLGGLTGGDAECQARADAECLGGRWKAWLGDGVDGPATRFAHSADPYARIGGGVVAENWEDLIDGTIEVPLSHDETGAELPADDDMIVFTAVFHTGGNPTPVNCLGWTDASDSLVPTGLATAVDTGWTVTAPNLCSENHHLYCFEQ